MKRYELPFDAVEAAELEEVKGDLLQVLQSLNLKDLAADLVRGTSSDLFYKVPSIKTPSHYDPSSSPGSCTEPEKGCCKLKNLPKYLLSSSPEVYGDGL